MGIFSNDWVLIPLLGISIFIVSYNWSDTILSWLHRKSLGQRDYVIQKLDLMFVEIDQKRITIVMLLMSFGIGFLFFLLLWPNFFPATLMFCIMTALGWTLPKYIVDYMYNKRCSQFGDQMVDGLTIMGNGVRSGLSVPQSMERVVENMGNPISQEFGLVISQMRLGLSYEEALTGLANRIPRAEVQMFVLSVNILRETGGNLGETFSTIVETIRERQKIEKKIEALTAQGVMQGVIITMVPFFLLFMFAIMDPAYIRPLFTTTLGVFFLLAMLALQITGGLMIRNIVKIKV
ncbi:MAG: type II secretion system F family protein [Bdellovibrionales bacterium]